jgi:hypothetical protein
VSSPVENQVAVILTATWYDKLDKYRTAPQRFAFELGLWHIDLAAGQIPDNGRGRRLADSIIAHLGSPDIKELWVRGMLRLIRPYATPEP